MGMNMVGALACRAEKQAKAYLKLSGNQGDEGAPTNFNKFLVVSLVADF